MKIITMILWQKNPMIFEKKLKFETAEIWKIVQIKPSHQKHRILVFIFDTLLIYKNKQNIIFSYFYINK